uniref:Integrase, catalytic region, zinc finger, CCHC-type, peptidase aspartic, catalytic n=1 Tax=Tanacetum cinerariifolium TaxID=118510 RepID=A0A6L2J6Z1_TANCI|nr:hypothetical protein [Tanacetum cinerariifolium]
MANLSEDIQCVGFDTKPPMFNRTDFASWQQQIRLYGQGKKNRVNILKSFDEGPFQMGTLRETLTEGTENIKMTMSRMQVNSKFVNNMLPEWGRFITAVKLNKGLRDSNYDQLYAYLKQHEHYPQSFTTSPSTYVQPHLTDTTQLDSRLSPTDNLIENLTNILSLLTQSYKTYLPQTNNQLRTSSNPKNQATIQDGKVTSQGIALNLSDHRTQSGQDNVVDDDVDEQPIQDLALNVDNVFQADECDAFDSDVDEAPTAHTMFMANLSSADPVYDEAGSSYDSDVLSEYVKDNAVQVVQSDVSAIPNDAYMMILNNMHKPTAQHVYVTTQTKVVDKSLTAEPATYKEQFEVYERRARFELTEREQKIDEQLKIFITDRNIKEENLKKELHSVKMQLASTINHNKSMVEEVTTLKKDFKQKENQYLEEFLDMKALKEKVEDKLFKQDQSLQTVHMLCKPKP